MTELHFGLMGHVWPPCELSVEAAKAAEAGGFDFMGWGDQLGMSHLPDVLWTEEFVPRAAQWQFNEFLEPWPLIAAAAQATERLRLLSMVVDVHRLHPAKIAQLALTIDHLSHGRFTLGVGIGEAAHVVPFGISRDNPLGALEEALRVIRLLWSSHKQPVDFDGRHYRLDAAYQGLQPYGGVVPRIVVAAAGTPRVLEIAGRYADGWAPYLPLAATVEEFADQAQRLREIARRAGRSPDDIELFGVFPAVIDASTAAAETQAQHPILRWQAAVIASGPTWQKWNLRNPFGDAWFHSRDLIPSRLTRQDVLRVIDAVPVEAVLRTKLFGSALDVAKRIQGYVDAGMTSVVIVNYASLLAESDFGAMEQEARAAQTVAALRELHG